MGLIPEFQQADAGRRGEVKQRQHEVDTMLKEFNEAHSVVSSELRNSLTQGVIQCRSEVTTMLQDFVVQAQGRQAEVAAIAQEATAIVEAADTFVKDLAKGGVQRRSEVGKIRSEVALIHEMVWGKAPTKRKVTPVVKDLPREAAIATAPAGELSNKVFAYLAHHPDGTRLTELEEEFGVARIQTARVVRELMDGNKVEKRDLLYFVI